ncbi:hypothetical protein HZC30_07880 [Candidatus Woesearchaeota archaeon]|nr:hypothetical protein [Candidatus Woesearchaeota archaeon]
MINFQQEMLREAKGWEKFKIKFGLTDLPAHFACRNLYEFLISRSQIGIGKLVMFPKLYYFPQESDSVGYDKISLKDGSASIDAYVRPSAFNLTSGELVANCLKEVQSGDALYFPVLRNGMPILYTREADHTLYLAGFETIRNPRSKRDFSAIMEKLSSLVPEFNHRELVPIPSHV